MTIKTDSLGNFVWDFTSDKIEGEKAGEYVENTPDGGYIIFVDAGNTEYLKLSESKINTSGLFKLTTFSVGNGYINPSRSCLLYTSPSPRDKRQSRMPSSA